MLTRLDTVSGVTTTTYELHDHLSNRIDTDTSGVGGRTLGTLPFGDVWYETGTAEKWKFNTYERDTESNLDYAKFRFYSPRLGCFMSPDLLNGDVDDPQSLNRYAYVSNDPINLTDPDGLACKMLMGINTKPGSQDSLLSQYGIEGVYEYKGGRTAGVRSVLSQDYLGASNSATNTAVNALNTLNPNEPNTVFAYSGGAQTLSTGYNLIIPGVRNSITSIIYLSPGTGLVSSLPGVGDNRAQKFHGTGPVDALVTMGSRLHGGHGTRLRCTHSKLLCMLENLPKAAFVNCKKKLPENPELPDQDIIVPIMHPGLSIFDILGIWFPFSGFGDPCPNGDCGPRNTGPPTLIDRTGG